MKKYISVTDISPEDTMKIIQHAIKEKNTHSNIAENMLATLLFEKPSLRTKLSFQIAMQQLGGASSYFDQSQIGIGTRESPEHIGQVISSMSDIIIARTYEHSTLEMLGSGSQSSTIVINALSDLEHPCQALADLMTLHEHRGDIENKHLVYIGNANNNITHSLYLLCAMLGIKFTYSSPHSLKMNPKIITKAKKLYPSHKMNYISDPDKAVKFADVIVTDCWVNMGSEHESESLTSLLTPYQVNTKLIKKSKNNPYFLHCLPAKIGSEVTKNVFESKQSLVFKEAENRLHIQKSLLSYLIKKEA